VIRAYPMVDMSRGFQFSPDGKRFAMVHTDGLIRLWDVATRQPILALDPDGNRFDRFTFSTDGRWYVGGGGQSQVLAVWDATAPPR
jgi:WD40 repeat protein